MKKIFCLALSISLLFVTCFTGISTVQAAAASNYIKDGGFDTTTEVGNFASANKDVWQKDSNDTVNILTEEGTSNKYAEFKGNGLWYVINSELEQGKTYRLSFQLKKKENDTSGTLEVDLCEGKNRYVNSKAILKLLPADRAAGFTGDNEWATFYCDFTYDTADKFFEYNTLRFYTGSNPRSIDNVALTEYNYGLIADGSFDFTTSLSGLNASKVDVWGYGYSTWAPEVFNDNGNNVMKMYRENGGDLLTYVLGDKIKVGSTYQLTFKVKANTKAKQLMFNLCKASDVGATTPSGSGIGTTFYPQSTDWETLTHTFTVTDAAYNALRFQSATGIEFLLDDISLVEIVEEEVDQREKIVDGGFDTTTALSAINASKPDVWSYLYGSWAPSLDTLDGNKVLKTNIDSGKNNLFTYYLGNKLEVGKTYKLTFKAKAESKEDKITFQLTKSDVLTVLTGSTKSISITTTDWATYTHTFTFTDAEYNTLRFETTKGKLFYYDDFSLVDTSIPEKHTVTAWTSNTYYGDVVGDGEFLAGEVANLNAVPTNNGKFVGWYNSEKQELSTELSYIFVPEKDMDIFAKFTNVSSAEKNNPRTVVGNFKSNAIRAVVGNQALRFKYTVSQTDITKDYNGYKLVEYGYIAANVDDMIENGDSALTLDSGYVSAAAYISDYEGNVSKDVYLEKDDEAGTKTVSVALKNIGYNKGTGETNYSYYSKDYVVRSYAKYENSEGAEILTHGTQYIASVFDTMHTILSITENDANDMGYDWTTVQQDQASVNALLDNVEEMKSAYESYDSQN